MNISHWNIIGYQLANCLQFVFVPRGLISYTAMLYQNDTYKHKEKEKWKEYSNDDKSKKEITLLAWLGTCQQPFWAYREKNKKQKKTHPTKKKQAMQRKQMCINVLLSEVVWFQSHWLKLVTSQALSWDKFFWGQWLVPWRDSIVAK